MNEFDEDVVWKAMADPTRREILNLLKRGPLKTGDICHAFEDLTRFGVMKHLRVLYLAQLVLTREEGRTVYNYLNVTPLKKIYELYVRGFQELWADKLWNLKQKIEKEKV